LIRADRVLKISSMATNKLGVNLAFVCIVAVLALTAATAYYHNSGPPAVNIGSMAPPSGGSLPANHPDIEISKKIAALENLIAREANNPEYQTQLANLYYDSGQYEKAAAHYQKSLDLRPGDPNVETDLAVSLHYNGQDDKALEILNRVLAHSPGFSQALFNKGIILITAMKDVNGGIRVWEELMRSDPEFARKAELEKKIREVKESIR
jgi:tetratricopeptide (TPR) repeat protein